MRLRLYAGRMLGRGITTLACAATALAAGVAQAQVPHDSWPKIDGQTWVNEEDRSGTHHGGPRNDKLLGGHGNDVVYGHRGADVIWGDYKPTGNTTAQRDVLRGGGGADWIYGSHGANRVLAGPGRDTVRVWFGRGRVDCGAGRDILYVSHASGPHVKRRNCERISHKSARDAG
jgi:RTX calcium-binding nonapeptide repeat (4 copies)